MPIVSFAQRPQDEAHSSGPAGPKKQMMQFTAKRDAPGCATKRRVALRTLPTPKEQAPAGMTGPEYH